MLKACLKKNHLKKMLFFSSMLFFILPANGELYANNYRETDQVKIINKYSLPYYDKKISKLITRLQSPEFDSVSRRIAYITEQFLNAPYLLGGLGEGYDGKFDRSPPYRTDSFDCLTLVSTVLALANAKDLNSFQRRINDIRYHGEPLRYENRNHFMTIDWNYWNQKKGYVVDITDTLVDSKGQKMTSLAETYIDKQLWYQQKHAGNIKLFHRPSKARLKKLLEDLHGLSEKVDNATSQITYLPITDFFDNQGELNPALLKQLPEGSLLEIIRPNWDLRKEIGTRLNVSHVGFLVQTDAGLQYRAASSIAHRVVDIPLERYLRYALKEPTIDGINIQQVKINHG